MRDRQQLRRAHHAPEAHAVRRGRRHPAADRQHVVVAARPRRGLARREEVRRARGRRQELLHARRRVRAVDGLRRQIQERVARAGVVAIPVPHRQQPRLYVPNERRKAHLFKNEL